MKFITGFLMVALTIVIAIFFMPALAASTPALDMAAFRQLPVLNEGRIKPLGVYARLKIREFSGTDALDEMTPEYWLAETLFDPAAAADRPLFYVHDARVKERLGLAGTRGPYSLDVLKKGLDATRAQTRGLMNAPSESLTAEQRELLRIHEAAAGYESLLRAFSLILPLAVDIPPPYARELHLKPGEAITYERAFKIAPAMTEDLKRVIKRKGENPAGYNEAEKRLAAAAFSLSQIADGGSLSGEFRVFPSTLDKEWVSPWAFAVDGHGAPETAFYFEDWKAMTAAFRANDPAAWSAATSRAEKDISAYASGAYSPALFRLEIAYDWIRPFTLALAGYLIAACFAGVYLKRGRAFEKFAAPCVMLAALITHGAGIATRIVILGRPPVGTLYESALFVAFIGAAGGYAAFRRKKDFSLLIIGCLAAATLLAMAPSLLQKPDSMEMLVAVLNTNFWLTTHVLCITSGYAACLLTGLLAHIDLFYQASGRAYNLASARRRLHIAALAALLLTAAGTALGGVWADQSWGRFWGWDPKENGALLIVLWLLWILHGRKGGNLGDLSFAALAAALNIIVALAWFGVNLLNVGLHSYGFTQGLAWGLGLFCGLEILVIGSCCALAFQKQGRSNAR